MDLKLDRSVVHRQVTANARFWDQGLIEKKQSFRMSDTSSSSLDYSDGSPPSSASWLPKVYKHDIATM